MMGSGIIGACFVFPSDPASMGLLVLRNARDKVRHTKVTVLVLEDVDPAIYSPWVRRRGAKYLFVIGQDAFPFLGTESFESVMRWKEQASAWSNLLIDLCRRCRKPCGLWALACSVCFQTMCYACAGASPQRQQHVSAMCERCCVGRILFPKRRMLMDCTSEHDVAVLSKIAYRQKRALKCAQCGGAFSASALGEGRQTYACFCLRHPRYCSRACARAHRAAKHAPFCTNRPLEEWHEALRRDMRALSPWARRMVLDVLPTDKNKKVMDSVDDI